MAEIEVLDDYDTSCLTKNTGDFDLKIPGEKCSINEELEATRVQKNCTKRQVKQSEIWRFYFEICSLQVGNHLRSLIFFRNGCALLADMKKYCFEPFLKKCTPDWAMEATREIHNKTSQNRLDIMARQKNLVLNFDGCEATRPEELISEASNINIPFTILALILGLFSYLIAL